MIESRRARSSTERASGPMAVKLWSGPPPPTKCPVRGTRSLVGRSSAMPQKIRGEPDAAAEVGADVERHTPRRDDRGAPSGAAAGRARDVVRVLRAAVNGIVRLVRGCQLGN